jgi:hypothetical protein
MSHRIVVAITVKTAPITVKTNVQKYLCLP